jgi:hypothetical protein
MTPKADSTTSKLPVSKGNILGVGLEEGDGKSIGLGALASVIQKRPDIVSRDDFGEATRRRKRGIAVAGGDVEDALACAEIDGFAQRLADDLKRRADNRIIA